MTASAPSRTLELGSPILLEVAEVSDAVRQAADRLAGVEGSAVLERAGDGWALWLVLGVSGGAHYVGLTTGRWAWTAKCEHRLAVGDHGGPARNDGSVCSHALHAARGEAERLGVQIPDPRRAPVIDPAAPVTPPFPYELSVAAHGRRRRGTASAGDLLVLERWKQWRTQQHPEVEEVEEAEEAERHA